MKTGSWWKEIKWAYRHTFITLPCQRLALCLEATHGSSGPPPPLSSSPQPSSLIDWIKMSSNGAIHLYCLFSSFTLSLSLLSPSLSHSLSLSISLSHSFGLSLNLSISLPLSHSPSHSHSHHLSFTLSPSPPLNLSHSS